MSAFLGSVDGFGPVRAGSGVLSNLAGTYLLLKEDCSPRQKAVLLTDHVVLEDRETSGCPLDRAGQPNPPGYQQVMHLRQQLPDPSPALPVMNHLFFGPLCLSPSFGHSDHLSSRTVFSIGLNHTE